MDTHLTAMLGYLEHDVLRLAEAMPEAAYASLPPMGNFEGARNFGEQLRHLAAVLHVTAATVWQVRSPEGMGRDDNGPHLVDKAAIVDYARRAFAYGRAAAVRVNEENERELIPSYFGPMRRGDVAWGMVYHGYNHYGQMVVLARCSGVAPAGAVNP